MIFVQNDAGRTTSKRPKQDRDCVVRALALALVLPYDKVYDVLAHAGRITGRSTPKKVWQKLFNSHPRLRRTSFPAVAGVPRVNIERFTALYPTGRWILQCAGHLTVVIEGVVHDTFSPRCDACVYAAWKIEEGQ